jgi:hypothetical protein
VLAIGGHRIGTTPALFVGGNFTSAGGVAASHAAAYTGTEWQSVANTNVGSAPSGNVWCSTWFDDDGPGPHPARLYIGGDFQTIGALQARHLAVWDGSAWSEVAGGADGPVYALKGYDDGTGPALAIAGAFVNAGGVAANHVARLQGGQWAAFGSGVQGSILALEAYAAPGQGTRIYVGGSLASPALSGIAYWNGASWVSIPIGSLNPTVTALSVFDDGAGPMLYAGCSPGLPAVQRWNGTAWASASSGLTNGLPYIDCFAVFDDGSGPALYAGGSSIFFAAATDNVGRFQHGVWMPVSGGPGGQVAALTTFNDGLGPALYATGYFTLLNGPPFPNTPALHLAKYRNGRWSSAESLLPSAAATGLTLASNDPDGPGPLPATLALGGSFLSAGGVPSVNVALFTGCSTCFANCDGSTTPPVLSMNDFVCFQQRFSAADPFANCDGSTSPPVLNVADFVCFMQHFAAGCPG